MLNILSNANSRVKLGYFIVSVGIGLILSEKLK